VMHEAQRRGIVRIMPDGRVLYPGLEHILAERGKKASERGTTEDRGFCEKRPAA
jgi:hypothetical protein